MSVNDYSAELDHLIRTRIAPGTSVAAAKRYRWTAKVESKSITIHAKARGERDANGETYFFNINPTMCEADECCLYCVPDNVHFLVPRQEIRELFHSSSAQRDSRHGYALVHANIITGRTRWSSYASDRDWRLFLRRTLTAAPVNHNGK